MNQILLVFALICSMMCNAQTKNNIGNSFSDMPKTTKMNKTEQEINLERNIHLFAEIFRRANYKKPDENLFRKKIWEYCGIDISQTNGDYILRNRYIPEIPVILTKERCLLSFEEDVEPSLSDIASGKIEYEPARACVDINKILFYDDVVSTVELLNIPDNEGYCEFLVSDLKYEKNVQITKKAAKSLEDLLNYDTARISNIMFYHFNTRPEGKRYRRDFVRQILHQYEGQAYSNIKSILEIFITNKLANYPFTQDEKDRYVCYFLEECLSVAGWGVGDTRSQCYSDTAFSQRIAKKNYYGLPLLFALSKNTNLVYTADRMNERDLPAMEFGKFPMGDVPFKALHGIINDPDGYVNVRNEKNASSEIKDKIIRGEEFLYWEDKNSDWWKVMTKNIIYGYVHKSRIQKAD